MTGCVTNTIECRTEGSKAHEAARCLLGEGFGRKVNIKGRTISLEEAKGVVMGIHDDYIIVYSVNGRSVMPTILRLSAGEALKLGKNKVVDLVGYEDVEAAGCPHWWYEINPLVMSSGVPDYYLRNKFVAVAKIDPDTKQPLPVE